jgi:geranylgeranyl diphosphate synthase type I
MALKQKMQVMLPAIEEQLRRVIFESLDKTVPELREMLAYHMGWEGEGAGPDAQGKRIRPLVVLLCADSAGLDWRKTLPAAAAVELLHNFSLVHDDIQDQSPLRRSRPTVWVKWGMPQAINAGDILFTLSFASLQDLESSVSYSVALEAGRVLQRVCLDLTRGQYLDISYEGVRNLNEAAYWPMVSGKTSALLGGCCELGALSAGVDLARRQAYRDFGSGLGLAFQVLDDWLGIWGDVALTGKSTESDLVSGKKTLPVLYGLTKGSEFARRWLAGSIESGDVAQMVDLLRADGAEAYTLQKAAELTQGALDALSRAVPEDANSSDLRELADMLLQRKH